MREVLGKWLHKNEWLLLILVTVVFLRVPTLFEPYWYGDEGIYLTIGQALRSGEKLYTDIHDNKPPLLYWVSAMAGGNQFWFRMILAGWNLMTIAAFAKLAGKFWPERKRVVVFSTWVFAAITSLPYLEGNIGNAELFFLLPTITAALILFDKHGSGRKIFLAGILLGLGGLFKVPALIEAGVWPIVWLFGGDKKWLSKSICLTFGLLIPWAGIVAFFVNQGTIGEFLTATFGQNLNYLSAWKVGQNLGIYSLKGRVVVVAILLAIMYGVTKRVGRLGLIVGVWGTLTLFAVLLSGRPYPHYLLQMAGVMALIPGLFWVGDKLEKTLAITLFSLIVAAYFTFNFYAYQVGSYYLNFGKWAVGSETQETYYGWFDPGVNNIYKIARIVRGGSQEKDKIWVWGDTPMIYALARRLPVGKYITKYHIKELRAETLVIKLLQTSSPLYIVDYGKEEELPGLKDLLDAKYGISAKVGGAIIYRLSKLSEMYN